MFRKQDGERFLITKPVTEMCIQRHDVNIKVYIHLSHIPGILGGLKEFTGFPAVT